MPNPINIKSLLKSKILWLLLAAALVAALLINSAFRNGQPANGGSYFKARRGNLTLKILEGGSVEALESQEIRSQFKGYQGTKILRIVEEGYLVTEEDVQNGKVLVELDSADLRQKIINQDIQYQSTLASLIDAQQAFDIIYNQNLTDLKAAQQKAKFARLDLEKFLGARVAAEVIEFQRLYEDTNDIVLPDMESYLAEFAPDTNGPMEEATNELASAATEWPGDSPKTNVAPGSLSASLDTSLESTVKALLSTTNRPPPVDFSRYADAELLGDGAAKQQLRKLTDDLQITKAQLSLARTKLEGTRRLFEKKFVTRTELDTEELAFESDTLKAQTAQTALDLYKKYEFPKQGEEYLSKYEDALRGLTQARRAAVAKLAQARARLKAAEGRFKIESEQRRDLYDQLAKCVIKAERTGLVVYGTDGHMFGGEQIREGATVRERQKILTIPDMKQMSVKVKIHESFIKQVQRGQRALIRVDAYPDEPLSGEVYRVAMLPDYQNRWMNPDVKVYVTTISIAQQRDWLKPGMSAKVEILVKQLTNVVYIPLQAVSVVRGQYVCYVKTAGAPEQRPLTVGDYNDEFIEIKEGLADGEMVLLNAPQGEPLTEETRNLAQDLEPTNHEPPAEMQPTNRFPENKAPSAAKPAPRRNPAPRPPSRPRKTVE